jgi:hypothetical protein
MWEAVGQRIVVQAGLGKNVRPYMKNNLKQKELRRGSSSRVFA